jgi:hypothetical protein
MPSPKQRLTAVNEARELLAQIASHSYTDDLPSNLVYRAKMILSNFPELGLLDEHKLDPSAYGKGFGEK